MKLSTNKIPANKFITCKEGSNKFIPGCFKFKPPGGISFIPFRA